MNNGVLTWGRKAGLTVCAVVVLTVTGMSPAQAQAQPDHARRTWRIMDIRTSKGFQVSQSRGANPVNDAGLVAGQVTVDGLLHAAVYNLHTERVTVLDRGPKLFSSGSDVNNKGEVTGRTGDPDGRTRAFVWSTRTGKVRLAPLSLDLTLEDAVALNDHGDVLINPANPFDEFAVPPVLWRSKKNDTVNRLDGMGQAFAVNNHRWVVGRAVQAAVWTPKHGTRTLPLADGFTAWTASAINDHNEIVGLASGPGAALNPVVLWKSPTRTPCVVAGRAGEDPEVWAINKRREMAGTVYHQDPTTSGTTDTAYWKGCNNRTTILPIPPGAGVGVNGVTPNGINRSAQIVGWSSIPSANYWWERRPR